jgi:protein ImuA
VEAFPCCPPGSVAAATAEADTALPQPPHPALWRADQLGGGAPDAACATGFRRLDGVLPGAGWPRRALTDLLLARAGIGEIRLLAPALVALQRQGRCVMLFDPPARPSAWAWRGWSIDVEQVYVVESRGRGARAGLPAADLLWALEQALKSGQVGAVLAWLPPRVGADALRRLQLAAQSHDGPAFLLRDESVRSRPSPAPLRLLLRAGAPDTLRVQLLKRRGPPLAQPFVLDLPPVLPEPARRRAERWITSTVPASVSQEVPS